MDNVLLRDLEALDDYREASERTDLLLLWSSVEAVGSIVVELKKCLYGLQEAAKVWYKLISKTLMDAGFTRSEWDKCLFFKKNSDKEVYIVLYVDDMLLCGTNEACVDREIGVLNESFSDKVTVKEGK